MRPWLLILMSSIASVSCFGRIGMHSGAPGVRAESYANEKYSYHFEVPTPFMCVSNTPPSPNHGCGIDFRDGAVFWVDGMYNVLGWMSPSDALDSQVDDLLKAGMRIDQIQREPAKLDSLTAGRLRVTYWDPSKQALCSEDLVIAIRPVEDDPGFVYTVAMAGDAASVVSHETFFAEALKRWHIDSPARP